MRAVCVCVSSLSYKKVLQSSAKCVTVCVCDRDEKKEKEQQERGLFGVKNNLGWNSMKLLNHSESYIPPK